MTTASTPPDDETSKVVRSKLQDAQTPGFEATFDPDEAERAGAFAEDALSASDAAADAAAEAGSDDVPADAATLEPVFLDDDGPADEVPPHVSTTNARELFGLKPGETVAEAAARQAREG